MPLTKAIAAWQRDHGLSPSGAFDTATARALGVSVKHTEQFPVLHLHSCGGPVLVLQTALGARVTGTFDTDTLHALRAWQSAHGLGPSGVTDTATAAALGLNLAQAAGEPTYSPTSALGSSRPLRLATVKIGRAHV